jgi:uncharacterized protein
MAWQRSKCMRDSIIAALESIEVNNGVKILYAAESGSRAWGFASADSDFDVRFIYIHHPDWYLSVEQRPDTIELPVDSALDVNGWDLKKALLHIKKSNPTVHEWLDSPIVYMYRGQVAMKLRELERLYFSPVHAIHHYLSTAVKKYEECADAPQVNLKKYFYMLRPLFACMWIEEYKDIPPMAFQSLMDGLHLNGKLLNGIDALMKRKTVSSEADVEDPNPLLMDFIGNQIDHFELVAKTMPKDGKSDFEALNSLFQFLLADSWGNRM